MVALPSSDPNPTPTQTPPTNPPKEVTNVKQISAQGDPLRPFSCGGGGGAFLRPIGTPTWPQRPIHVCIHPAALRDLSLIGPLPVGVVHASHPLLGTFGEDDGEGPLLSS